MCLVFVTEKWVTALISAGEGEKTSVFTTAKQLDSWRSAFTV